MPDREHDRGSTRCRPSRLVPTNGSRKREKGRPADYRGAVPEQVAAALLRHRPNGDRPQDLSTFGGNG